MMFTTQLVSWQRRLSMRRSRLLRLTPLLAVATVAASAAPALAVPTSPPPVTFLSNSGTLGRGDIFITPTGEQKTYANGPEILDTHNNVVWFKAIPAGQTAADFRAQTYHHRRVLTYWQGTGLGGLAQGTDYVLDNHYHQIATVQAGNGLSADGHEFLITPQNTALILAYTTAKADLSSIGGSAHQTVINGVVQEINIKTGKVLFEWNSAGHVPYSQSEQPLPTSPDTPWDWFHVNAVHIDGNGSLLIDARNTWATYKVNRSTGAIVWTLGGKASSFTLKAGPRQSLNYAGEIFAWQHDPESLGHGLYTWFDNESTGTPEFSVTRAVTVRLNEREHTATLIASDDQPSGLLAPSQGNAQTTKNGNLFVGWGALPYFSAFDPSGQLLLNARFPTGVNSYRAYFLPWSGTAFEARQAGVSVHHS